MTKQCTVLAGQHRRTQEEEEKEEEEEDADRVVVNVERSQEHCTLEIFDSPLVSMHPTCPIHTGQE